MPALQNFVNWWSEIFTGVSTTLKGMKVTGKYWVSRGSEVTGVHNYIDDAANAGRRLYPSPDKESYAQALPQRFRGDLHNDVDICIGCFQCQKACPVDCFWIECEVSRESKKRISRFDIDLGRCIYCHLCVDACPEDKATGRTSLIMTKEFEGASFSYADQVRSFGEGFYTPFELLQVQQYREEQKKKKAAAKKAADEAAAKKKAEDAAKKAAEPPAPQPG